MDCKKIRQSEANKRNYQSPLIEFLGTGTKSRQEVAEKLNVSDREARFAVSELSMFYPVISSSDRRGYVIPKNPTECSKEELEMFKELLEHSIKDFESRIKVLKKRMKPIIAWLKVAEMCEEASNE